LGYHGGSVRNLGKSRERYELFLRFRDLAFGFMVQNDVIALFVSFSAAVCWRRTAASPMPRPVAAARFAALSHMLIKGFFKISPFCRRCGWSRRIGVVSQNFICLWNANMKDGSMLFSTADLYTRITAIAYINEQQGGGF
jgi:hypothetical protein